MLKLMGFYSTYHNCDDKKYRRKRSILKYYHYICKYSQFIELNIKGKI